MDKRAPLIVMLVLWPVAAVAAASPPPAAAFAALPEMSFVRLAPDGRKVAWANDPGGTPVVVVFDLTTGRDLQRLTPANARVRDLDWADDRTLIISISRSLTLSAKTVAEQRYVFWRYLAVDVASGKARSLLMEHPSRELVTGAYLERLHVGKDETVIMSTWNHSQTAQREEIGSRISGGRKDRGLELSLFEVNTRSGDGKLVESGSPFTDDWVVDGAGRPVARLEWNPETRISSMLVKDAGGWRTVYSGRLDYEFSLEGLSADGLSVLALSPRGGDRFKVWAIPLAGGEMSVHYEHPEHDVMSVERDRFSGAPAGYWIGGPEPFVHWTDPKMAAIQNAVAKAFPGKQAAVFDRSRDHQHIVARVESSSSAPVYYLIDFSKGSADIIGDTYPALAEASLGSQEFTSYPSLDGTAIPAYLTLPPGREPKRLPLVVFPHGGPYARDDSSFDWWAQFLATRGYAVLQPQFRGSWGFGAPLFRAGHRQWGRGMQDDISAGVRHLVEQGIADADRVCIVGASYGGYAALAGAAFTPELYRCAISVNGIADIPHMAGFLRKQHGEESDALRAWKDLIGNPSDEDLSRFSPARSLASIEDPILLIHATDDTIVPFSQTENFARLLDQHGKHHQVVRLEGEDHWLSSTASRLRLLEALEAFLAAHLQSR